MKRIVISYVRNNIGYKSAIECDNHEEVLKALSIAMNNFIMNGKDYEYYHISVLDYHI